MLDGRFVENTGGSEFLERRGPGEQGRERALGENANMSKPGRLR